MKLVSAPLNNPFSVSFAQVDVTEPISGMHDANPIPAKDSNSLLHAINFWIILPVESNKICYFSKLSKNY